VLLEDRIATAIFQSHCRKLKGVCYLRLNAIIDPYVYRPLALEDRHIRLLQLLPVANSNVIECEIFDYTLNVGRAQRRGGNWLHEAVALG
jgi:hypothetical protein